MDTKELKQLRISIWSLVTVLVVIVCVEIFLFVDAMKLMEEMVDGFNEEEFSEQLEELYLTADYKMLEETGKARIKSHPNDDYSYFYLGLMSYQRGEYGESKRYLEKAMQLDPIWSSRAMEYIEAME